MQIFMVRLEKKIFWNAKINPLLLLQYLDDIFCVWADSLKKLPEFFIYLNSCHPTIKFTMNYSSTNIDFLGISITKNAAKLSTDIFIKDTDSYQYQHTTSCHLSSCEKFIIYGPAIGIKEAIEKKT